MIFQVAFQVKTMFHENEVTQLDLCQRQHKRLPLAATHCTRPSAQVLCVYFPFHQTTKSKDVRKPALCPASQGPA